MTEATQLEGCQTAAGDPTAAQTTGKERNGTLQGCQRPRQRSKTQALVGGEQHRVWARCRLYRWFAVRATMPRLRARISEMHTATPVEAAQGSLLNNLRPIREDRLVRGAARRDRTVVCSRQDCLEPSDWGLPPSDWLRA